MNRWNASWEASGVLGKRANHSRRGTRVVPSPIHGVVAAKRSLSALPQSSRSFHERISLLTSASNSARCAAATAVGTSVPFITECRPTGIGPRSRPRERPYSRLMSRHRSQASHDQRLPERTVPRPQSSHIWMRAGRSYPAHSLSRQLSSLGRHMQRCSLPSYCPRRPVQVRQRNRSPNSEFSIGAQTDDLV
jgi:hypothetical protein